MYELLSSVQAPSNRLASGAPNENELSALGSYQTFLRVVETILTERRSTVLPKQATVFTTNYDVFLDVAVRACPAIAVAAGFDGAGWIEAVAEYSSGRFFLTTYDTGNLYDYRVELPSLNLVKLHGCVSWQKDGERIVRRAVQCALLENLDNIAAVEEFVSRYAVVLPQLEKFRTTVMDRTYYELLRLYANALDRANVLLVAFGFSFRDEHILHITRRALKNPTLRLVAFAHNREDRDFYAESFAANNNALIVAAPEAEHVDFERFNGLIGEAVPKPESRL
jgi:SIR2-like protein